MAFTVQGTVLVKQDSKSLKVQINPTSDYCVHHSGKDYTVFVSDDGKSLLVLPGEDFEVDQSIEQTLVQCAIGRVKVELELAINTDRKPGKRQKIAAVHVPARPVQSNG